MDSIRIAKLKELINKISDDIAVNSNLLTVVNEALTHSSISRGKNYEKLEFLGDAVLRLAAMNLSVAIIPIYPLVQDPACEPSWSATAG